MKCLADIASSPCSRATRFFRKRCPQVATRAGRVLSFAELFEAGDVSMTSTTATTDAQIRTLTQKLAAASQNVLKLEREATTAEGAIRDLRSQLAAARAAASRPVTVESPRPPPIDPARLAALEQELQSERRRREEVEDELRQLQAQKRSPPRPPPPPPPPPEPRPGLELGPAGFEQLKTLRKEVERLNAALEEESERRRALQRRLESRRHRALTPTLSPAPAVAVALALALAPALALALALAQTLTLTRT